MSLIQLVGLLLKYIHTIHLNKSASKKFILMNQRYRQNAKKLFVPIFDELQEITYLKRYYNYFDSKVSSFVSSDLIRQEIEEKYNDLLMKLSKDDKYYEIKLSTLNTEKSEFVAAAENFDKKIKEIRKKEHSIIT